MKIAFVLSGGGARGIAHLGFIDAMKDIGITPDIISGTSAGAIVGGFYANGYSSKETINIINKTNLLKFVRFSFSGGLLSMQGFKNIYEEYFKIKDFESLPIELKVVATDIHDGKEQCFYSGDIVNPIMASSTIPTLFEPTKINGKNYIDGGVVNNFPVEYVLDKNNIVFGQYANPWLEKDNIQSYKELIERTFHLAIHASNRQRMEKCHYFQEPKELANFTMFDITQANKIYKIGYNETIKNAKLIEEKLKVVTG
ncbi:MAG TPA: patatin [Flavobacteriales bacterium]|nr:patatin [Flavobacteriales bacterium]|tara:strand:+ start:106365 stop:107132 length:768 start_codon:yes stop_codon:yes gene_type:complete